VQPAAREEIEKTVRRIEKIETAVEPRFQEHFVNANAIPHAVDPFPELAKIAPLPPSASAPRARNRAMAADGAGGGAPDPQSGGTMRLPSASLVMN
jgi:uncharacterized 2Fe-2S/4Fe-4S cluster protein (DUF4445 family)